MRIRIPFLFLLATIALPLAANQFSDFYVIPAAGHVNGVSGATWQSNLVIHNFQTAPITVELAFVETGVRTADNFHPIEVGGSSIVTVAPGATLTLDDVLNDHRGRPEAMGAILIGADQPFAVSSRSFANTSSGSTIGQVVHPVSDFLDNVRAAGSGVALIPGLTANARFRTNLGFLAAAGSGAPFVVEVSVANRSGTPVGTSRTFAIPAGARAHLFFPSTVLAGALDGAVARFRIVSGMGALAPFASMVENSTNNAIFFNAGFPPGTSMTSGSASFFWEVVRSRPN